MVLCITGVEIRYDAQWLFIHRTCVVIGETAIVKDDLALDHGDHAIIGGGAKGFGEHRPAQEPPYRSPARRGSEICLTRPLLLLAFPAAVFFRLAGGSWLIPSWTMIPSLSSSGIASFTFCPKLGPEHLATMCRYFTPDPAWR